jgi:dTDP-4-dehydrorhamnose reductase
VFDGQKDGEYVEDDGPAPVNVYGESKLEGERLVLASGRNLVLRTSWVYGRGRNFITTIVAAARAKETVTVVADQVGRPTWARDLARGLVHLVESGESGIVHLAGEGDACSWADLAEVAIGAAGVDARVERVDTATYGSSAARPVAPRPANSTLSVEKARALGTPLAPWRESVPAFVRGLR